MLTSIIFFLLFLQIIALKADWISSHRCVGWHFTSNSWLTQSCHYKNVCYLNNKDYNGWIYVKSNDDNITTSDDLIVSILPQTTTDDNMWGRKIYFKIISFDDSISLNLSSIPLKDSTHILYESYIASNFGHFLADELLPLYALSYRFGLTKIINDIQVIQWKDDKPMEWSCDDLSKEKARGVSNQFMQQECAKFYLHMFPLVSPLPLQLLTKSNSSFCVTDMLAGIGWLSDHCYDSTNHGRNNVMPNCPLTGHMLWKFRLHLMNNNNKYSNGSGINMLPMIPLFISGYDHKRAPPGMLKTIENLAANLNLTVHSGLMHQMSISEQITLLSRVKLFITTTGGASMISLFLPEGASVILIAGNDGYLDHNFYSFLSHINVYFMGTRDGILDERQLQLYIRKALFVGNKNFSSFEDG